MVYALAHIDDYSLPLIAAVNLGFYLGGYAIRLRRMTKLAKVKDRDCTQQYFVDEAIIASTALLAVTVLGARCRSGRSLDQWRTASFRLTHSPRPGGRGLFYAGLICRDMIYSTGARKAFCISLNAARDSSPASWPPWP